MASCILYTSLTSDQAKDFKTGATSMNHRSQSHLLIRSRGWLLAAAFAAAINFIRPAPCQEIPKAPNAQVTALTPTPGYFTEPAVAVNPANPQQVVAVFQDNAHAAYSVDAGRSWQIAEGVEPPNYRVSGDVSTAFDNQ